MLAAELAHTILAAAAAAAGAGPAAHPGPGAEMASGSGSAGGQGSCSVPRPFLASKLRSRAQLLGSSPSALAALVDPALLPPELGGSHADA
ncbi:hypothetical protein HYH03_006642 [Edaphochlamys debaryana]|uniref:Secreted protein n=1 Tax=Edaphochlamys debaryana TaxID=47281 RepID=A0A835Y587_9CHLO|nr:hypothetical protein HYH03_006642 [Edaphochlamys debaryana]|eukprot:KAG2495374.1 hypothetical protein HYH03_006642 [Edaphochlamys debaryana]